MIRRYVFGTTKCMVPAKTKNGPARLRTVRMAASGTARRRLRRAAARVDQDLGVALRVGERAERRVDAVEPDLAGDQRARVHIALGEHPQSVAELERRVADDEAQ